MRPSGKILSVLHQIIKYYGDVELDTFVPTDIAFIFDIVSSVMW